MSEELRARVHNGQLVTDEPLRLPEGTQVRVVPVSSDDELESPERLAIEAAVEDGFQDFEKGAHSDAHELAKELLARP